MICAATGSFEIITLGSSLAAFGQVFFINTASKLATTWFGDKEVSKIIIILIILKRGVATAFGGLSIPVGCIMGFAVPALMISDGD